MLNSFWGFHSTPFANPTGAGFLPTAASEEAFARIQYLVDQNHRMGILQGESGIGKSVLLGAFERVCKTADREVCQINVVGMGLIEFLHQVAMQLNVFDSQDTADTWQKIFDQIQLNSYQQRDTVLLFDDVDEAHPEILTAIRRLAQRASQSHYRLTIILSVDTSRTAQVDTMLFELASLRVDLWPWTREEVHTLIQEEMARVGTQRNPFAIEAMDRIFEISRGIPRMVSRIAELSLAAAAGQEIQRIDADTVDSVADELQFCATIRR